MYDVKGNIIKNFTVIYLLINEIWWEFLEMYSHLFLIWCLFLS